jgi:hypothetical protein
VSKTYSSATDISECEGIVRGVEHTVEFSHRLMVGFPEKGQTDNDHDGSIDDRSYHIWCPDVRGSQGWRHPEIERRVRLSEGWGESNWARLQKC